MKNKILLAAPFALAVVSSGCHRAKPANPSPIPAPVTVPASADRPVIDADRAKAERERAEAERVRARSVLNAPIYFDFDEDRLSDEAMSILDQKRSVLVGSPEVRIRIAGHADDRGSDEYNMTLGQRRAAAARSYLGQAGIDLGRMEAVSYGEERPMCHDPDESCRMKNRRAEIEVISGPIESSPTGQ